MREPIKPEDIQAGDLIRREPRDLRSLRAVEYVATDDGHMHGIADSYSDAFYLLDRPKPAVDLPTEPTLGWVTSNFVGTALGTWERYEGSVGSLAGEVSALVRERDVPIYDVTAFVPAVAVPKAALDELRAHWVTAIKPFMDSHHINGSGRSVDTFLAAVDAANGADQ